MPHCASKKNTNWQQFSFLALSQVKTRKYTSMSNPPKILIKPSHHQPSGPTTIFSSQPSPPSPSHHRRKRRPPHRFATMPVSCNAPLARANKQDISTKKRNGDVLNVLKHATERYKIHHHEYVGYVCRHK